MLAVHVPSRAVVQCTAARTINVILQDCDCISQINALDTINYWGVSTIALIQPDIVDCCVMGQKKKAGESSQPVSLILAVWKYSPQ